MLKAEWRSLSAVLAGIRHVCLGFTIVSLLVILRANCAGDFREWAV